MKSILDPSFRYTTSFNTDLRTTFAKIRRGYRKDTEDASKAASLGNVSPIVKKLAEGLVAMPSVRSERGWPLHVPGKGAAGVRTRGRLDGPKPVPGDSSPTATNCGK
jgi:hypothetical protein